MRCFDRRIRGVWPPFYAASAPCTDHPGSRVAVLASRSGTIIPPPQSDFPFPTSRLQLLGRPREPEMAASAAAHSTIWLGKCAAPKPFKMSPSPSPSPISLHHHHILQLARITSPLHAHDTLFSSNLPSLPTSILFLRCWLAQLDHQPSLPHLDTIPLVLLAQLDPQLLHDAPLQRPTALPRPWPTRRSDADVTLQRIFSISSHGVPNFDRG